MLPGDANEDSIVSCLKELTQLLIWGDQHDPSLLEHFFEQKVHWHFLEILQSKDDGTLIVQVLQTLNIMFENVRSRQSLYFLLSNNYVNEVIGLRYDFSNDEILAYYIYLLRTLSFKLSKDTIYFFFNEHLDDFPLYSEAIKFFNHEESMIRIAVRVITLNVYSVNDRQMQDFILDRTTTTYFSNLVWFIGNYGTTVNDMLLHRGEGEFSRMNYYLAEHMDCFYYVNDIIELDVPKINKILISHLLNRLLRPMYLDSLHPSASPNTNGNRSSTSFGLLGTSPASFESMMPVLSAPMARFSPQHPLAAHLSGTSQQQNPFKTAIYEYLSQVDSDRLVLPALLLVYLAGRNPGVMSDVLLGTDIYPQRLLKSKMLMGNLMSSSSPPSRTQTGAISMSRERSSDSILSTRSAGVASSVVWATPPPVQGISSTIAGSLFGAAGSATAARMRTRTESPLFETDEADEESRETEELLLASADSQLAEPPASSSNRRRVGAGPLSTSLPSSSNMSSLMSKNHSTDGDSQSKKKPRSGGRRGSKPSSLMGPSLSSGADEPPVTRHLDGPAMVQELKPVFTSKEDREGATTIYPSTDEDDEGLSPQRTFGSDTVNIEQDPIKPPPLPPRPASDQQQDEIASIQDSVSTQVAPIIESREELMDRLVDIICGQPESGAHRFRILTIQVAAELLIEFVYTKGGAGKETAAAQAAHQAAAESQLGESRLYRLALAEAQTRDRVQKGIRALEKKKKSSWSNAAGPAGSQNQPLGMLTGRIERSLTESKLGMDKQVVNFIAESSVMYGPDKDLENELDLDPDPDLVRLFDLDPEFTSINRNKLAMCDDEKTLKGSIDLPPTSNGSSGSSIKEGRRMRMKSKIKSKTQTPTTHGQSGVDSPHHQPPPSPQPHRPSPTALSRLEAMVVRYIKWLHILMQCRQIVCRNPAAASAVLLESLHPLPVAAVSGTLAGGTGHPLTKADSPTISITETTMPGMLDRRPSDFLGAGNISTGHLSGSSTPKAPATTATTTSTTAMSLGPDATGMGAKGLGGLLPGSSLTSSPSTQADSAIPSASSSTSSLSSMNSSHAGNSTNSITSASATLSQPATGTASGRAVGSRTLLTATAALEAAAQSNQHQQQQHQQHQQLAGGSSSHPFMNEVNEMLSTHLDPLSSSVSEVIRKSSAKLKNGGSTAVSSAASSVRSVKSKAGALPVGMERTVSAASSVSTSEAPVVIAGGAAAVDDTDSVANETDKEDVAAAAAVEPVSILDPSHPAHQSDEQVIKILETLGLKTVNANATAADATVVVKAPDEPSSRAESIISSP
ncbi:Protein CL16A [Linnemannia exigua]|uniref:Protein CL16A n=1 Tax=Linnemannia exigua TaxID=604196 RepID=A0AAD4D985_9FUNG|nr:Protein CL16A [Linnemannia exigua]